MDTLSHRLGDKVKGILEGFDRIVFKGILKPLAYAAGMQGFLQRKDVLNKNYKEWVSGVSGTIVQSAEEYSKREIGQGVEYLSTYKMRKEAAAHEQQKKLGIESGLVGAWSCVENCQTFKATFNKNAGYPLISKNSSRCKHLYFYYDHEDYGFMSIRLQTWAPFEIQIALNGREWLKRSLSKAGIGYALAGNKFLDIGDFDTAQKLLDSQLDTRWVDVLSSFVPSIFPAMGDIIDPEMSYTWTLWQSEWAKDYIFRNIGDLNDFMPPLLRHAFITGTGERVLRYFGHPVSENGQPRRPAEPEIITRFNEWYDGARIRHWLDGNSLKFYNELNVLRFEFTMNDPSKFKIHRHKEGDDSGRKLLLPMRQGIADINTRTQVCSQRISNLTDRVAALDETATVEQLISSFRNRIKDDKRSYRALDLTGKDLEFLKAVSDPVYDTDGITNKALQKKLLGSAWANGLTGKKLSAKISRQLALFRKHGIIHKFPKQHKYFLTEKGRQLSSAIAQTLGAKLCDLAKLAA